MWKSCLLMLAVCFTVIAAKNYSDWGSWSQCPSTCYKSIRQRHRLCYNETVDEVCTIDDYHETEYCFPDECNIRDLIEYHVPCNATCTKQGVVQRYRICSTGHTITRSCNNYVSTPCSKSCPGNHATEAVTTAGSSTAEGTSSNIATTANKVITAAPVIGDRTTAAGIRPSSTSTTPPELALADSRWIWIVIAFGCLFLITIVFLTVHYCVKRSQTEKSTKLVSPAPSANTSVHRNQPPPPPEMTAREAEQHMGSRPFSYTMQIERKTIEPDESRPSFDSTITDFTTTDGTTSQEQTPQKPDPKSPGVVTKTPRGSNPGWSPPHRWNHTEQGPVMQMNEENTFNAAVSVHEPSTSERQNQGLEEWIETAEKSEISYNELVRATPYGK